jgi:site-specific recombinase XerC
MDELQDNGWSVYHLIGPKLPLKLKEIWGVRTRLQMANRVRDLALFDLGFDSKLRIGDVTIGRSIRSRCMVVQQKTGRPVQFEITDASKESLIAWLEKRGAREDDWIFPSRSKRGGHLTTRQYGRLVDEWVSMIGLDPGNYGTHSMRRTRVALIYKKTGNLRACQLLLGRSKLESTVRYLGVDIEDALPSFKNGIDEA